MCIIRDMEQELSRSRPDLHIVPPVDYDTRPNLYASLGEDAKRAAAYRKLDRRIAVACFIIAALIVVYFAAELARAL
jgi:hypothetical protein